MPAITVRSIPFEIGLVSALVLAMVGCHGGGQHGAEETREIGPAVIVLDPESIRDGEHFAGHAARPPVEFDHEQHAKALGNFASCTKCHNLEENVLQPRLKGTKGISDLDSMMELYHQSCIGCHEERADNGEKTGPRACGECHRRQPAAESNRRPLRFDLSLHGRHTIAEGDHCERCHHVYDEGALVHYHDTESACSDCHGETSALTKFGESEVEVRSLREASHLACVSCHRQKREAGQNTGPENCTDCHTAEAQAEIERLETPPRLIRGQPDARWIKTDGATSKVVGFHHESHERTVERCSTCHHQTLSKCGDCHTLNGGSKGGGVNLEQAFHHPSAQQSCVGCHQKRVIGDPDCAGCHSRRTRPPGKLACLQCHNGPNPADIREDEESPATGAEPELVPPPRAPAAPILPEASDDFPTDISINVLAKQFGPAKLPHRRIAEALSKRMAPSLLARAFHGEVALPCAGCHHNSPAGTRPPSCRSCHPEAAHVTRDRPGLVAAYHRQCIGCHQQMGLATDCEACHERAQ